MKANPWVSRASFQAQTLPEQLELLLAQRAILFHQQQEVLERLAALAQEQRALRDRQTVHELRCHVFWRRLRQASDAPHSQEAETAPATELLPV